MHTFGGENIDRAGERCWDGWNEDRKMMVVQLFNDESWDEGILDLSQRRSQAPSAWFNPQACR